MNILSLFDGMSCGQIAMRELGMTDFVYYASEIDKYAIEQTQLNFPDTIQLGDVTRWRDWHIDWAGIDLVLAGSPCQGFSFAGKQLAFDDPRSSLFFVFSEILTHVRKCNPKVRFLLENVNMKKEHLRVISEHVGVFPVNINSALVSAQNRNRWYWTDIRTRKEGLFSDVYSDIPQPEDRGIMLRDILEAEVDGKYYLSDRSVQKLLQHKERNDAAGNGFGKVFHDLNMKMAALKVGGSGVDDLVCVRMTGRNPDNPSDRRKGIYLEQTLEPKTDGKTNCLTGVEKDNLILQLPKGCKAGNLQSRIGGVNVSGRGIRFFKSDKKKSSLSELGTIVFPDQKADAITSQHQPKFIQRCGVIQMNPCTESGGVQPYQQNRVYDTAGKSPALMAGMSCGSHAIVCHNMMPRSGKTGNGGTGHLTRNDGKSYCLDTGQTNAMEIVSETYPIRIRRLTPIECARLQTIPAWFRWKCSETQQYRLLGNGWTVEVIKHILKYILED